MSDDPKFRYYKVEGDGLGLLKAYKDELDALVADRQKLEGEFAERSKQQANYHHANLRSLWQRLAASVGLDPNATWGSPEYQIEARYLDDGFGALLYIPRPSNPMRDLLGKVPVAQSEDPAVDLPPKDTTRH